MLLPGETRVVSRANKKLDAELAQLETMSPAQLKALWPTHFDTPAPSVIAGVLRRLLAQRIQERRLGGIPPRVFRALERCAEQGSPRPAVAAFEVTPDTMFIREWNDRTITVEASAEGFVWEGQQYRSLSHIAREVTGAQWSGPRFFGLTSHA